MKEVKILKRPLKFFNRSKIRPVSLERSPRVDCQKNMGSTRPTVRETSGPYLGFFVCWGKLGFREISDQYSYKKQPSKIRHYVRKKTFSFPGGGNCPLRPPAMYGPANVAINQMHRIFNVQRKEETKKLVLVLAAVPRVCETSYEHLLQC